MINLSKHSPRIVPINRSHLPFRLGDPIGNGLVFIPEFLTFYNHHRAHMERDNLPPIREVPTEVESLSLDQVVVKSHVGGLVKSFERKAS